MLPLWYFSEMIITPCIAFILVSTPLEIHPADSNVDGTFLQSTFLPGTLIGNWNSKTAPDGTTTLPGYWGGSGNNLIDCELTPSFGGPFDSSCSGGLEIELHSEQNSMSMSGLSIVAFENSPSAFPLTLGMVYGTFRTTQPSSLFPGDIPFEIPLGEGSLTSLRFEQLMPQDISLVPISSGMWSYSATIPVTITFEADIVGTPTGPLVGGGILQIQGVVEQTASHILLSGESSWESNDSIDNPPIDFENMPMEIPTIIPAGGFASILLSATAETATLETAVNFHFDASAEVGITGDVDGDGYVGVNDLLALIAVWGTCDNCVEDINHDGTVNVTDLLVVIGNWSSS